MTVREGLIDLWVQRLVSRNWKLNDAAFGLTQLPPTFFFKRRVLRIEMAPRGSHPYAIDIKKETHVSLGY